MTKLFKPKMPKVPEPTPVPQIDEAAKRTKDFDEILRRRGAGYNILTSEAGLPNLGTVNRPKVNA